MSTKKINRALMKTNMGSLTGALLHFAQLTITQREQFAEDPNEFLAAEDDEIGHFSIRTSCIELIQSLSSAFG